VFEAARDLPAGERLALLREACAGDEHLGREVESLLAHDAEADSFIEEPAFSVRPELLASGITGRTPAGRSDSAPSSARSAAAGLRREKSGLLHLGIRRRAQGQGG